MNTVEEITRIDTAALNRFAQTARRQLREQVTARLDRVLKADSIETRERESAIKELKREIERTSREAVIDRVAYTWFNRFCALRFMDVNHYTNIGVVSPAAGFTQPEILADAKQGHIDDALKTIINEQKVFDLLSGSAPSPDPQQEAYRFLLVAVCNYYHSVMPFLFEKIADYTELLMPDDLLSDSSVLTETRTTLTKEACKDVEIIGWLYQFYISEKKNEVFEDLKKNKKISAENIPAATQLFTPNWIVRYLAENSLGRLWMLNKPKSRLVEQMDYYISPTEQTNFVRITKPEELKICDPACGSGHMLVYTFDLLYKIYEEEGYEATEIPRLILENNLFGIEIDERAGELAAFALTMKAREKYKRFFSKPVQPKICVLENVTFEEAELKTYFDALGHNLFTDNLRKTLLQFSESSQFGSLIRPVASDVTTLRNLLQDKDVGSNIFLHKIHDRVLSALRCADYLSPKYHIVIANPPYMGAKGMNPTLKQFAEKQYPDAKSDTFAMFLERSRGLTLQQTGLIAMIVLDNWMFQAGYEKFRSKLLSGQTLLSVVHMPYEGRGPTSMGISFGTTAMILLNAKRTHPVAVFDRIRYCDLDQDGSPLAGPIGKSAPARFLVELDQLLSIPTNPIAYWISGNLRELFTRFPRLSTQAHACSGIQTGDNGRFLRLWYEVSLSDIGFGYKTLEEAVASRLKWFPHKKGGDFRRWYGNNEYIINWSNDGAEIRKHPSARPQNVSYMFREGVTWSHTSSGTFSARYSEPGFTFNVEGPSVFSNHPSVLLGFLCSSVALELMRVMSSTLHYLVGSVSALPFEMPHADRLSEIETTVREAIDIAQADWNCSETSWDFAKHPLLDFANTKSVELAYSNWAQICEKNIERIKSLEKANNEHFANLYGLHHEVSSDVEDKYITLQRPNPRDTVKQFVSYAVGCMFGRYSLDKTGLILANQAASTKDYLAQIAQPSFRPDDDNVIPILDGDWFADDITERFRKFLRTVFGEEQYDENLQYIEKSLGKDLRKYFLTDFYTDHVKRYKKRPIYWLFSSPQGTFNALVYLHRYRPDTVSVVLNDYLREFRNKLTARKSHLDTVRVSANASATEKNKALKEIELLKKSVDELDTYERDVLYPLATQKVQIHLDDGVRINYAKFGKALRPIPGMSSEDEE